MNFIHSLLKRLQQLITVIKGLVKRYPWIISVVIVLLVYWRLPLTFFEQDEWQAFETYINQSGRPITDCLTIQRPMTCVINRIEWELFGLHPEPYGFFSLLLISAITVAFYRFLRHWPVVEYKAVIAAALFPLLATGSQAITWFGAFSASLPSFLFAILALNFFMNDLKRPAWYWQLTTLASIATSLYFKEDTLWFFPVMIVTWLAYRQTKKQPFAWRSFLKGSFRHLGLIILAVVVFLYLERLRQTTGASFTSLISTTDTGDYRRDVLKALVLLPFQHIAHILIPPELIGALNITFQQTIVSVSLQLSLVIIAGCLLLLIPARPYRPLLFTLLVWLMTAFAPYAVFGKNPDYLEGRYYFAAQAPLVAFLTISLLPDRLKLRKIVNLNTFGAAILAMIMVINLLIINYRLIRSVNIGQDRKHILAFIQKATGPLPKRAIIFAETPNFGYVGLADYLLPFQNGLGTTLRVVYQGNDQDYRPLSKKQAYLWNIVAEGYDEVDGVGFGYYRRYDNLIKALDERVLPVEMVYAFKWHGGPKRTIIDNTDLLRGRLLVDQKQKILLPRNKWQVKTSDDKGVDEKHGVDKLLDKDPKSDWSVFHKAGEFIEVDMGEPINDVGIVQLKTADGNSFAKIYRFDYSPDGINWKEYFTEEGKLVNDNESPIIFGPKTMQKFRITIVDERNTFFNWSVSDINVFAVK